MSIKALCDGLTCSLLLQRSILFDLRDEIVPPTNETVAQVFARISAYRDSMDGPQVYPGPPVSVAAW